MKRSHLIAILVGVALLLAVFITVPVFMFLMWKNNANEAREFARKEMELSVSVPTSLETESAGSPVIINIDTDGQLFVDGTIHSKEEVARKLKAISLRDKNQPIVIRSDKAARWESVTKVITIIEESGLWNISFATQASSAE